MFISFGMTSYAFCAMHCDRLQETSEALLQAVMVIKPANHQCTEDKGIRHRVRINENLCFLVYSQYYFKKRQTGTNFVFRAQFDENGSLLVPDQHHTIASLNNQVQANCPVPVPHIITNISLDFFVLFVLQFQFSFLKDRSILTLTSMMR